MYRNIVSLKGFQTFILSLGISAGPFWPPLIAHEVKGWQSASLHEDSGISKSDLQQIDEVLLKRLDRWNAHDIEGYMQVYWKSPKLLIVVGSEQFNGWEQLHDSYLNAYPDRSAMGFIEPARIQVRLLKPDLALALTWWTINFPSSHQKVVGNTIMNLQKFDDGWKIVASHSSTNEM
jgi:beta-aspartyl-peptidase (threonine type)